MLLELARTLARDDLDHRRLDPDRLVDDVLQRLVDVPAVVVDVVQVELELHRPPLRVPLPASFTLRFFLTGTGLMGVWPGEAGGGMAGGCRADGRRDLRARRRAPRRGRQ